MSDDPTSKEYRICDKCDIHHYENCDSCFGFGVYSLPDRPGELFPVTAHEAMETKQFRGDVQPCPECHSTVLGLPINKNIYDMPGAMKVLLNYIQTNSEYTKTLNEDGSVTHSFTFVENKEPRP